MTNDVNYMTGRDPEFERQRLASQANLLDARTFSELSEIGVTEGWSCLELGAGTGTVVRWLLDRVGSTGRVVAVDLDTTALEQVGAPNLEVRSGDVTTMDLGEHAFDLVVGRLFFEHVPERESIMAACVRALKPGGWLWAYDADWTVMRATGSPSIEARWRVLTQEVMPYGPAMGGTHPVWGNHLVSTMDHLGLTDVTSNRMEPLRPAIHPTIRNVADILSQRMNRLGELPRAHREKLVDAMRLFEDPELRYFLPGSISAWGRKPA